MKKFILYIIIGTLSSNCVPKKNQKQPNIQLDGIEQPRPIEVGTAEVQLQLIEHNDNLAVVQVKKILGYGMSTGRLAPSQHIEIYIHNSLTQKVSLMKKDSVFNALLSQQPAGIDTPETWEIIKILTLQ